MSALFPNGTVFSMAKLTAAAVAITAISNANPGVASCAAPPAANSIGVLQSAWPALNNRVVEVGAVVANTSFALQGFDTTDVTQYPAGQGAGSIQVVNTADWVPFSQVSSMAKSGGTQQYFQWQYVEDPTGLQQQRPTIKNAKVITLTFDYDPTLAWYDALVAADRLKAPVVLRAVLPGGAGTLYYYVYPSFDGDPTMDVNKNMQNTATFSLISLFTRY